MNFTTDRNAFSAEANYGWLPPALSSPLPEQREGQWRRVRSLTAEVTAAAAPSLPFPHSLRTRHCPHPAGRLSRGSLAPSLAPLALFPSPAALAPAACPHRAPRGPAARGAVPAPPGPAPAPPPPPLPGVVATARDCRPLPPWELFELPLPARGQARLPMGTGCGWRGASTHGGTDAKEFPAPGGRPPAGPGTPGDSILRQPRAAPCYRPKSWKLVPGTALILQAPWRDLTFNISVSGTPKCLRSCSPRTWHVCGRQERYELQTPLFNSMTKEQWNLMQPDCYRCSSFYSWDNAVRVALLNDQRNSWLSGFLHSSLPEGTSENRASWHSVRHAGYSSINQISKVLINESVRRKICSSLASDGRWIQAMVVIAL